MSMERCASAPAAPAAPAGPVLNDSDYFLPCHGIADTGLPNKVLQGTMSKDTGKNSSRINQIIKQAGKYPGPGKYIAHTEWKGTEGTHNGNKFSHSSREWKPLHKGPDPSTYERKDFGSHISKDPTKEPIIFSNAGKDNLSNNRRILHGRVPKGKKRSFLDQAERHGAAVPAPGQYYAKEMTASAAQILTNKPNPRVIKMTSWDKEMVKTVSRGKKVEEIGPDHYHPKWDPAEDRVPQYSVPKENGKNFLAKAVGEKMTTRRPMLPIPGPGHYPSIPINKTSRGTLHVQLRGLSRAPVSGYL